MDKMEIVYFSKKLFDILKKRASGKNYDDNCIIYMLGQNNKNIIDTIILLKGDREYNGCWDMPGLTGDTMSKAFVRMINVKKRTPAGFFKLLTAPRQREGDIGFFNASSPKTLRLWISGNTIVGLRNRIYVKVILK